MKKLLCLLTICIITSGCATTSSENPNIILFVVDDLGWTDLSCYGSNFNQTPNIDQLAAQGMLFTDAYASCTVCSPTRASIMTGKYPARLHCTNFIPGHDRPFAQFVPPPWKQYLDTSEYTLAEALQDEGYLTIHLGKWHLGEEKKFWPEWQGFDLNIGGWSAGAPRRTGQSNGYFPPYGNPRLKNGSDDEYLTERLAADAVNFIENRKGKKQPFFMNFWFYNVHTPLQAREEKIQKYKELADAESVHFNPVYAAMVEHMDEAVGKVLKALEDNGIYDHTIIVFTSDNGGLIEQDKNRHITSNHPLRSGKGDIYEGGVRVPFIVSWNGRIRAGSINANPVISCDIYPTLLGLINSEGDLSHNSQFDGVDLSGTLLNETPLDRPSIYWHFPHYHTRGAVPYGAIRKGEWKLISIYGEETPMLFNLKEDIGEQHNLAAAYPEKTEMLLEDMRSWRVETGAQDLMVNPHYLPELEHEFLPPRLRGVSRDSLIIYFRGQ
jgi:arylsulfatase A